MADYPSHFLPSYSDESKEDALFHYTGAVGLIGLFTSSEMWSTAYYCANDEQELSAGKGALLELFRTATRTLQRNDDPRLKTFAERGVYVFEYADSFERQITALTLSALCAYFTCFCKAIGKEDFMHGLLSQWRGYGPDGGYALQFSRKRLLEAIERTVNEEDVHYDLQDVHYSPQNPLRDALLGHKAALLAEYEGYLTELAGPIRISKKDWRNPIPPLLGGPLESLLEYLVHTKNHHFQEERECRLSLIQPVSEVPGARPVRYFNRNGLAIPYLTTPRKSFDVLGCIDWILIGPGPRVETRFKSVTQMIKQSGKNIKVRASHIPFTRA
jgi:hypothetical protein